MLDKLLEKKLMMYLNQWQYSNIHTLIAEMEKKIQYGENVINFWFHIH